MQNNKNRLSFEEYAQWFRLMTEKGCVNQELNEALIKYCRSHWKKAEKAYFKYKDSKLFPALGKRNGFLHGKQGYLLNLALVLIMSRDTYKKYGELGISDEIFFHTMSDIKIWCENCEKTFNAKGVENLGWLKHHLDAELFRIGRLQYQIYKMYYPGHISNEKRAQLGVAQKDKVLFVHIPRGEKLCVDQCKTSFSMAEEFFTAVYPYDFKAFITNSWLLYPSNREFMKPDSNILEFAGLFDIISTEKKSKDTIEFVFGFKKQPLRRYPEDTSLQRALKKHIENKGDIGVALGIIKKGAFCAPLCSSEDK